MSASAHPDGRDCKIEGTTAQFPLHQTEGLRTCPYDKSHKILETRFLLHLQKCRKAFMKQREDAGLPMNMEVCPYDYYHHIPKDEFQKHLKNCRTAIERGLIPEPGSN